MRHSIKTYRDGFTAVTFCEKCGMEGIELSETSCVPVVYTITCAKCGQNASANKECDNCQNIREKFLKAVDRSNLRN